MENNNTVSKGKAVSILYTVKDSNGKVIDKTKDKEPLVYIHGHMQIVPGLEKELEGKALNTSFNITIEPHEAYGDRVDAMTQEVSKSDMNEIENLQVGMHLRVGTPDGDYMVTVTSITDDRVTLDANHPLAGVTLNFEGTIVGLRDASDDELKNACEDEHHNCGTGGCDC